MISFLGRGGGGGKWNKEKVKWHLDKSYDGENTSRITNLSAAA